MKNPEEVPKSPIVLPSFFFNRLNVYSIGAVTGAFPTLYWRIVLHGEAHEISPSPPPRMGFAALLFGSFFPKVGGSEISENLCGYLEWDYWFCFSILASPKTLPDLPPVKYFVTGRHPFCFQSSINIGNSLSRLLDEIFCLEK